MAHFGFLAPYAKGHLYAMGTLALHLRQRGHRVTFFCIPDAEAFLIEQGLDCVVVARAAVPPGSTDQAFAALSQLRGQAGTRYSMQLFAHMASIYMAELPQILRASQLDALVIDQFFIGGATLADHLRLPRVHVCCAIPFNTELRVPPLNTGWGPATTPFSLLRNVAANLYGQQLLRPLRNLVNAQRTAWGLAPYRHFPNDAYAGHPQLSQQPPGFEYRRQTLPPDFHFVGPLHHIQHRADTDFPLHRLTGRRIVYASMGTLQNGLEWIFRRILEACEDLCESHNLQLVLSLGGNFNPAMFAGVKGDPVIVNFAPQLELLSQASLCITHAGLNTTLEALAQGVPMIAIPITNDQPAVAARIAWSGAGRVIPPATLTVPLLRAAIVDVLSTPSYTSSAARLQDEIAALHSLDTASAIVESVLSRDPL